MKVRYDDINESCDACCVSWLLGRERQGEMMYVAIEIGRASQKSCQAKAWAGKDMHLPDDIGPEQSGLTL